MRNDNGCAGLLFLVLFGLGTVALLLSLSACSSDKLNEAQEQTVPPSQLDINSAKRQCTNAASMGMIGQGADEAIELVCGCTIDKLVANGEFTSDSQPSEAASEEAMNACIDEVAVQLGES